MKFKEFSEQIISPVVPGTTITGNVTALTDPKMQAATLAQQNQQKQQQKKTIQDQISALTRQITDLRTQLTQIK